MRWGFCALVTVLALSRPAFCATFNNGSFEVPVVPAGSTVLSDGASIGPWAVGVPAGTDVALIHGLHEGLAPFDGNQFVNFNGGDHTPGGFVYEDFDTVSGK